MDGKLQADPKKFPSGLRDLSNRLAGMGKNGTATFSAHPSELCRVDINIAETLSIVIQANQSHYTFI